MLSLMRVGDTTSSILARRSTRSLRRPSSSPSTRAPAPPCRMRPGACQSAAQLTRQPTVRRSPTAAAMISSLSPFCSETIVPSAASRGARISSAAGVSCDFTASSTRSRSRPSADGVMARTGMVTEPSRESMVRPAARYSQPTAIAMFLPLALPLLFFGFVLLLVLLVVMIEVRVLSYAYRKIGVRPRYMFIVLLLTLVGSQFNIPLYSVTAPRRTLVAINVGGALVPLLLSVYLFLQLQGLRVRMLIGTAVVALI